MSDAEKELEDARWIAAQATEGRNILRDEINELRIEVKQLRAKQAAEKKRPRVGVAVLVMDNCNNILMSQRVSDEGGGQGYWQAPGGALEWNERWEEAAYRELKEETGLSCDGIEFVAVRDDIRPEDGKHYIIIFCRAIHTHGELRQLEPDKNTPWIWYDIHDRPQPTFPPLNGLLSEITGGVLSI